MDMQKMKGHGAMLCANAMWGLMSPLAKLVMVGGLVTPLVVTDLRVFGAMLLFWIASFFRKPEHVGHKDLAKLFVASLLAIVFNQGCFIFGVGLTSPADASIITTSMPLWAMVLAAIFLKEPITGKKVLGIAFGATGALLLIMGSSNTGASVSNPYSVWGDLLVLTAQLSYAFYLVLFKNFVSKYSVFTIMKWMFTYAFICLLPFSYNDLLAAGWSSLGMEEIGSILFIVVGGTFLCYVFVIVGLHCGDMLGHGHVQLGERAFRPLDIRRGLYGDPEPLAGGNGGAREGNGQVSGAYIETQIFAD